MAKGKRSLLETLVLRAYSGDVRALISLLNKCFPDSIAAEQTKPMEWIDFLRQLHIDADAEEHEAKS